MKNLFIYFFVGLVSAFMLCVFGGIISLLYLMLSIAFENRHILFDNIHIVVEATLVIAAVCTLGWIVNFVYGFKEKNYCYTQSKTILKSLLKNFIVFDNERIKILNDKIIDNLKTISSILKGVELAKERVQEAIKEKNEEEITFFNQQIEDGLKQIADLEEQNIALENDILFLKTSL